MADKHEEGSQEDLFGKTSRSIAMTVIEKNPYLYPMYKAIQEQQETLGEYEFPLDTYVDSDTLQFLGDTYRDSERALSELIVLAIVAGCFDVARYKHKKRVEGDRLYGIQQQLESLLKLQYSKEEK